MRKLLLGIAIGCVLSAPPLWAFRTSRPPEFHEWNSNTFTQLNDILRDFWNVTNGRFQADVVTTTPNGTRPGTAGECVYVDTTTDQWCCNVTGTTSAPTTVWKCTNMS